VVTASRRFICYDPQVQLPDQRTQLALGDLVSGEERYVVLMLEVLPLPLLPNGSLPTSLEGEELMGLEFAYTSITEEGSDLRLESRTSSHLVRIQGTQNPAEVVQNTELIVVIANQQAADAMRKAANSLTILGGKVPGGFYNATYVRPMSVQRINGPVPYYLVQMRRNVAGSAQTLYAAVLDDGNIVRPVPVSRYTYHPVRRSREKSEAAEEKNKTKTAGSSSPRSSKRPSDGRC
jgi:hypothetical protein